MYSPRALIIVDILDLVSLDLRQLLDNAGYSTDLVLYSETSPDQVGQIEPNILFFYISKSDSLESGALEFFQDAQLSDIPMIALTADKGLANLMFSLATVVLLLPVSEQRLVNLFSLLSSIDSSASLGKNPWDALTGFYTPSFFKTRLQQALADTKEAENSRFILYTINLEYLLKKKIDYGNIFRRKVLEGFSQVLRKLLRPTDIVSRFDDEQFMVLIENVAQTFTPATIAGRMLFEFEEFLVNGGLKEQIKIDIGVQYCNADYLNVDEILNDARMAMQLAKQDNLGSYRVFMRNRPKAYRIKNQQSVDVHVSG